MELKKKRGLRCKASFKWTSCVCSSGADKKILFKWRHELVPQDWTCMGNGLVLFLMTEVLSKWTCFVPYD